MFFFFEIITRKN